VDQGKFFRESNSRIHIKPLSLLVIAAFALPLQHVDGAKVEVAFWGEWNVESAEEGMRAGREQDTPLDDRLELVGL
jgi:hypothetical protein